MLLGLRDPGIQEPETRRDPCGGSRQQGLEAVTVLCSGPGQLLLVTLSVALLSRAAGGARRHPVLLRPSPERSARAMRPSLPPPLTAGWILIDRCGKHFGTILNYLRDGAVPLPESRREIEELLAEAKYYLVQGLVEECQAALQVGIALPSPQGAGPRPTGLALQNGVLPASLPAERASESAWSLSPWVRATHGLLRTVRPPHCFRLRGGAPSLLLAGADAAVRPIRLCRGDTRFGFLSVVPIGLRLNFQD